jgi:hypothetical protein
LKILRVWVFEAEDSEIKESKRPGGRSGVDGVKTVNLERPKRSGSVDGIGPKDVKAGDWGQQQHSISSIRQGGTHLAAKPPSGIATMK